MSRPVRGLRILLALETFGPGGAENMVLHLARELRARGALPSLLVTRAGWMTERASELEIPFIVRSYRRGEQPLWCWRLSRWLRREGVRIVHTHEFDMNAYAGLAAVIAGAANVATLHGSVWGLDLRRHRLAYRVLQHLGQRLVAVSAGLQQLAAARLGAPVTVIHNGIPVSESPSTDVDGRVEARRSLGLPAQRPVVVAVGSLFPIKDHASLLRAVRRLEATHVAIAGGGPEETALRGLIRELGLEDRAHLLGVRSDVPAVLRCADVFVQPSLSEGLPLAVLEAMAAARPVVATRVGGVPEAVIDGETGYVVDPGDPELLAEAIGKVLARSDRGEALGRAGWERARRHFSVAGMTDRYIDVYLENLRS
jgi:glycosyltransferase involved in cell wall biosynthesis